MIPPSWVLWLITSALAVVCLEYLYKFGPAWGWAGTMLRTSPIILLVQSGLYFGFRSGQPILVTWAIYALLAAVARVLVVAYAGELSLGAVGGCVVVLIGLLLMKAL